MYAIRSYYAERLLRAGDGSAEDGRLALALGRSGARGGLDLAARNAEEDAVDRAIRVQALDLGEEDLV